MKSTLIVLLLALAATGNTATAISTKPITVESGKPVPAERIHRPELTQPSLAHTAKISFLRDAGMVGAACVHEISVDGEAVFSIRAGEYQALYLAPGQHIFALEIKSRICPAFSARHSIVLSDGAETSYRIFSPSAFGGPHLAMIGGPDEVIDDSPTEPPFTWDSRFSTPGTSLDVREKSRVATARGTQVEYEFAAQGFTANAPAYLWLKHLNSYSQLEATIRENGAVTMTGSQSFMVVEYVSGEAVDLALVSGDSRAHAKTFPFPISAKEGNSSASVELMSDTGLLFEITFGGFQPGEKVEIKSRHKDEQGVNSTLEASANGDVVFPAQFDRSDRGIAIAAATGSSGTVSIQYQVGKKALVWQ